jgi:hypothetical protein
MKEIRFNTDREYAAGQKQSVTARAYDDHTVIFKDHQRSIYGRILEEYHTDDQWASFQDFVMFWYDAGHYEWDIRARDLT